MYNMDKLYEAVEEKGHVCIGLDTAADYIPAAELKKASSAAEAVLAFNTALVNATFDLCACYKVQIAYYEEMGLAGLKTYSETLRRIREKNCLVIADIKRGDIADTASRYARAHFEGDFEADFVTLSPYMGMDSIEPWIEFAQKKGKGAFVLMRTSNRGMKDFEYLEIKNTSKKLYDAVGDRMQEMAASHEGKYGYGAFGVVVGCTEREEAAAIREQRNNLFFLIPGYGAQGGAADDAALLLRESNGGVVNASRSILKAWSKEAPADADNDFAAEAARKAAVEMRDAIRICAKKGSL
ncbi:MAG: orotidine-5'-phosphate decarboxylase [Treponema sp.]|jgi:orotidine-5'-phosphate decarboxylase|nr:orotidine-5'-phosphate decarboxylase [Treponema sp.]